MIVKTFKFYVEGVLNKNEDKEDIQDGIVKIIRQYRRNKYFDSSDLYNGMTNSEIKEMYSNVYQYEGIGFDGNIKADKYKNKDRVKIYIDTFDEKEFHIGYAPEDQIQEIIKCLNDEEIDKYAVRVYITGGKYKYVEEDYYDEKLKIETDETSYGFYIEIAFHNTKKQEPTIEEHNSENADDDNALTDENPKRFSYLITVLITIIIFSMPIILIFYLNANT